MYDIKRFFLRLKPITGRSIIPGIILLIILFSSCRKFVTIPPPHDQVISATVFTDDKTATASVTGIYAQMLRVGSGYVMTGALTTYPGLSGDEIQNSISNNTYDPFATNSLLSSNNTVQNYIWRFSYVYIYQANACLQGLSASTTVSASVKKQLMGEAYFVRAYCYFYLTGLFGDVPLETSTDYQVNEIKPRTSSAIVLQQVITDLDSAQNLLNTAYPTAGPLRPNKWAAVALQARAYLFQKNWPAAETAASSVLNSGMYTLTADLNAVFLANSQEAIWQLAPVSNYTNTSEGLLYNPPSATSIPTFYIPDYTLNAFEAGDQRKTAWTKSITVGGQTYYYPYKYKVTSSVPATEYSMVLRYAEQYLIRAEARAWQNNTGGAIADLDTIRHRAGLLPLSPNLDQAACLLAVEQERRIELFMEWGHRWLDLRRTGRIDDVLGAEKPSWTSKAALFPVPLAEMQKNVFLTQNPGYD